LLPQLCCSSIHYGEEPEENNDEDRKSKKNAETIVELLTLYWRIEKALQEMGSGSIW
jgi:hypothetical protein